MRGFLLACLLCFPGVALANISLSRSIINFDDNGKLSEDIEVINHGAETAYVTVTPALISQPGTEQQKREIIRNPKAAGLLVTPMRLILAPGARKRVRFVRLAKFKPGDVDKVFRVVVKPEVGELHSTQTAVKIVVAYEVLILMQPPQAAPKIVTKRENKVLFFTNSGNTNVLLREGTQCPVPPEPPATSKPCVTLPGKRLYAGNSWSVELPFDTPVEFQLTIGNRNSIETY